MTTRTPNHIRNERGEVASWLILAAGLALAAALASSTLGGIIADLAQNVGSTSGVSEPGSDTDPGYGPGTNSDPGTSSDPDDDGNNGRPPGTEPEPEAPVINPNGTFGDEDLEDAFGDIIDAIDAGDDLGMSNGELNDVRDLLASLSPEERALVFERLTDEQIERIVHNLHSSGLLSNDYDDRERTEFYELLYELPLDQKDRIAQFSPFMESFVAAERATLGDSAAEAAFQSLIHADTFSDGPNFDERTAVLAAASNYPDPNSIGNLEQLTTRDWFSDMDLEDTQRSAQTVAFLTQYTGGDQGIINNTLDVMLADDSDVVIKWDDFRPTLFGTAGDGVITLNRALLPDGNQTIDITNSSTERMLTHTIAHEVNHIVNGDSVSMTYDYFMGEYRAFYVGEHARYGTPPTTEQVRDRVQAMITATDGAYENIADALADPVEGPKIAAFISGVVGHEVTPANAAAELNNLDDPSATAPTPVSVDGGPNNLDNS